MVTAAGKLLRKPLKGAGAPNPCAPANPQAAAIERDVEDDQSVGLLFTFGKFRMLDLADLEAHLSHELVCPVNLIGTVDVYHVNVHGQFKGMAAELAGAIRPTVAIMGNGARKGGRSSRPGRSCAQRRDWRTSGRSTTPLPASKDTITRRLTLSPTWSSLSTSSP